MYKKKQIIEIIIFLGLSIGHANSALIALPRSVSMPSFPSLLTVIDFNQFDSTQIAGREECSVALGVFAPCNYATVQVGSAVGEDVTLSSESETDTPLFSSSSRTKVHHRASFALGENGEWFGPEGHVGQSGQSNSFTFHFNSGPVNSVGGFMNYAPGINTSVFPSYPFGSVFIEALDNLGGVLESYDIESIAPIRTPITDCLDVTDENSPGTPRCRNDGAFRGILRWQADIFGFRVRSNAFAVLDDLTFVRIPEPPMVTLMLVGLFGLGFARLRKA